MASPASRQQKALRFQTAGGLSFWSREDYAAAFTEYRPSFAATERGHAFIRWQVNQFPALVITLKGSERRSDQPPFPRTLFEPESFSTGGYI
jgi:hypothetical protein